MLLDSTRLLGGKWYLIDINSINHWIKSLMSILCLIDVRLCPESEPHSIHPSVPVYTPGQNLASGTFFYAGAPPRRDIYQHNCTPGVCCFRPEYSSAAVKYYLNPSYRRMPVSRVFASVPTRYWIPAYAGMTSKCHINVLDV